VSTYITFAQICDGKNEFISIIGASCFIALICGDNIAMMIAHVELIDNVKNDIYIFFLYQSAGTDNGINQWSILRVYVLRYGYLPNIVFGAFSCRLTSRLRRNARSIGSFGKKRLADKKDWLRWKSFGRSGTKMPHGVAIDD